MQVGDLVRYKTRGGNGSLGIIVRRNWSGTATMWVVQWMNDVRSSYPERYLEVAGDMCSGRLF